MPGHGLIDTVVEHLGHEMFETLDVGAADVHIGAHPDSLKALENLDVAGSVISLIGSLRGLGGPRGVIR